MHRLHKSKYQVSLAQCTQLSVHWAARESQEGKCAPNRIQIMSAELSGPCHFTILARAIAGAQQHSSRELESEAESFRKSKVIMQQAVVVVRQYCCLPTAYSCFNGTKMHFDEILYGLMKVAYILHPYQLSSIHSYSKKNDKLNVI